MTEGRRIIRILVDHFFRRFFDSDTVQVDGETQTTVVRAASAIAVPGLMIAFFMQNQYPRRTQWGAIEDEYFFVLLTFVVMGAVAIFEWEMLFPDRLDFLVLSPLRIKLFQMLIANVIALFGFLSLFLVSSAVFGTILLPMISKGDFSHQIYAHSIAVFMAGLFASLFFHRTLENLCSPPYRQRVRAFQLVTNNVEAFTEGRSETGRNICTNSGNRKGEG